MIGMLGSAIDGVLQALDSMLGAIGVGLGQTLDVPVDKILLAAGDGGLTVPQVAILQGAGAMGATAVATGLQEVLVPVLSSATGIGPLTSAIGTLLGDIGTWLTAGGTGLVDTILAMF